MELVSALPSGLNQAGGFENIEVLGDGLPRQLQPMLHGQAGAQLKESLTVSLVQLVEDRASRRSGERLKHVDHVRTICKSPLACQVYLAGANKRAAELRGIRPGSNSVTWTMTAFGCVEDPVTQHVQRPGNRSKLAVTGGRRYNLERMATTRFTWQDAQLMPDDGKRYEAIDGDLYVTPAPSRRHQWVSGNLERALCRLLQDPGHGWVYHAPIGVEFPDTEEGAQPDIIFVSKARAEILVDEGIRGAPDLVIEIRSPTTAERDRTIKRKLYQRQGVAQYWIVDPDAETIEIWDFESGATKPKAYTRTLPLHLAGRSTAAIELAEIFAPEF